MSVYIIINIVYIVINVIALTTSIFGLFENTADIYISARCATWNL